MWAHIQWSFFFLKKAFPSETLSLVSWSFSESLSLVSSIFSEKRSLVSSIFSENFSFVSSIFSVNFSFVSSILSWMYSVTGGGVEKYPCLRRYWTDSEVPPRVTVYLAGVAICRGTMRNALSNLTPGFSDRHSSHIHTHTNFLQHLTSHSSSKPFQVLDTSPGRQPLTLTHTGNSESLINLTACPREEERNTQTQILC